MGRGGKEPGTSAEGLSSQLWGHSQSWVRRASVRPARQVLCHGEHTPPCLPFESPKASIAGWLRRWQQSLEICQYLSGSPPQLQQVTVTAEDRTQQFPKVRDASPAQQGGPMSVPPVRSPETRVRHTAAGTTPGVRVSRLDGPRCLYF